jgi:hypothetical protein
VRATGFEAKPLGCPIAVRLRLEIRSASVEHGLFHSILGSRLSCTLPLHVIRGIGTAALQRNDVINHISGTVPGRQSRLRDMDALAGSYAARSNRAESDRSACARRKSSSSRGAALTDEYARLWSHCSLLAFNCGTFPLFVLAFNCGTSAGAIVRATASLPKRYILAFSLRRMYTSVVRQKSFNINT